MPNEQVSAKPKPVRGLCLMKRKDESAAMKENGSQRQNSLGKAGETIWTACTVPANLLRVSPNCSVTVQIGCWNW